MAIIQRVVPNGSAKNAGKEVDPITTLVRLARQETELIASPVILPPSFIPKLEVNVSRLARLVSGETLLQEPASRAIVAP